VTPATSGDVTPADLAQLFESLKNWGRWGPDDQRGALNHLTTEHARRAAGLVRDGHSVSLARDLPVTPAADVQFPAHHHMLTAGDARHNTGIPGYEASRDYVGTEVHGLGITHVDALCHIFVDGQMYNGVPATEVRSDGAHANTVMAMADGVVGRGVLLDIAAARDVEYLEGDDLITVDDLERAESVAGVTVGTGDVLLVATGRDRRREVHPGLTPGDGMAGLHPSALPWLHRREVALLGSDGISDAMPGLGVPGWPFPVHQIGIVAIGLALIDNLSLGRLSAACLERGRAEFLFSLGVLRIVGGTGCPVNPLAVL
jgi:kynurenine formamidase